MIAETVHTHSMEQSPSWEANRISTSQEFPAFNGTRRFITAFRRVRYLSVSSASSIQSMLPTSQFMKIRYILSYHITLGLPRGFFPSGFPTKTLYTPLLSPIRATQCTEWIILSPHFYHCCSRYFVYQWVSFLSEFVRLVAFLPVFWGGVSRHLFIHWTCWSMNTIIWPVTTLTWECI